MTDKYFLQVVELPEIVKIILGEFDMDLREVLQSGAANANHRIEGYSLLELAVGWDEGVRILLEFGADASKVDLKNCLYEPFEANGSDFVEYAYSIKPLLQGGCILTSGILSECRSAKVRSLLIDEYAMRRRKLHSVTQSCLPPGSFFESLGLGGSDALLDVHAFRVYRELIRNAWLVDPYLKSYLACEDDEPVYHQTCYNLDAWDDLYLAGFRDIDVPDSRGLTPLMFCGLAYDFKEIAAIWLVDKGATLSTKLPFSKTTIAHLLGSRVTENIYYQILWARIHQEGSLQELIKTIDERKDSIFLIPSVQDCCICACCEGGCTTLLVAFRKCTAFLEHDKLTQRELAGTRYLFVLNLLLNLTATVKGRDHSIIRLFTFEALGLRHTCCREIATARGAEDYTDFIMDEEEIQNIRDENKIRYSQLDQHVRKFAA